MSALSDRSNSSQNKMKIVSKMFIIPDQAHQVFFPNLQPIRVFQCEKMQRKVVFWFIQIQVAILLRIRGSQEMCVTEKADILKVS